MSIMFFSGLVAVAMFTSEGRPSVFNLSASVVAYIISLLGLLWVMGFWGRWGVALFLVLAPVVLLLDYVASLFPLVTLIFAAACLSMPFSRKRS